MTADIKQQDNFKYAIHAFLAVVGGFFLTSWFCPKSLYYSYDLVKLKKEHIELPHEPDKSVRIFFIGVALYMVYNIVKAILKATGLWK